MDKLRMQTANKADENFRKLAAMFPNAVTETITGYDANGKAIVDWAIDKDVLMQEISCTVVDGNEERYQFTWPDKKKSVLLANAPINKTLRPCREESVDFDTTENLYIEGDNLEVLKLLQETYLHRVKMIYIDPPYNTGFNLIYHNDFHQKTQDYLANSGQQDENGNALVGNPETNGRFHTDWLNMMYPRLRLAKDLLTNDGVLCCAIDENEFATLSQMLKEIFGESSYEHSYVSVVHNPRGQQGNNFSYVNEYLIFIYPADNKKYLADFPKETVDARNLRDSGTESDRTDARNCFYPFIVRSGKIIDIGDVPENNFHPSSANVIRGDGTIEVWPMNDDGDEKKWRYARQSVEKILSQLEPKEGRNSVQIIFNKSEGTMRSVWANARYDASEYGTKLVQALLGDSSFTYPKSLYAVYDSVMAGTREDKEAIVLDFFSGSATTAHAVMQLNIDDGGKRKFIMVQVPENIDEKSKAYKAGYKTICEIGKERIRRTGKKIQEERLEAIALSKHEWDQTTFYVEHKEECDRLGHLPDEYFAKEHPPIDTGFRVLKCDTSNMKEVYYNPAEYEASLFSRLEDNIKEDRTPEDLLFQVMLDLGVLLSSKIEETTIAGKKVFNVEDNYLIACFDSDVTEETIKAIAKQKPYYFVMRDSSMANDSVATNFNQIFATYSPDTVRKVL